MAEAVSRWVGPLLGVRRLVRAEYSGSVTLNARPNLYHVMGKIELERVTVKSLE